MGLQPQLKVNQVDRFLIFVICSVLLISNSYCSECMKKECTYQDARNLKWLRVRGGDINPSSDADRGEGIYKPPKRKTFDVEAINETREKRTNEVPKSSRMKNDKRRISDPPKRTDSDLVKLRPEKREDKKVVVRVSVDVEDFFERQIHRATADCCQLKVFALLGKLSLGAAPFETGRSRVQRSSRNLAKSLVDETQPSFIDILAAAEISAAKVKNVAGVSCDKLSPKQKALIRVHELAQKLDLSIVGYALLVSDPGETDGMKLDFGATDAVWSAAHVHLGLHGAQCANAFSNCKSSKYQNFVILR